LEQVCDAPQSAGEPQRHLSDDDIEAFGDELEERRRVIPKDRYLPHIKAFPGVRAL